MFLRRIVLDNVRSIEHLELGIATPEGQGREWTFLLGENGTGKTTLLRAVALVLAGSEALPELLGAPRDWVRFGASEARIRAELETADGQLRSAELVIGAEDTLRQVYGRNGELLEQLDNAFRHTNRSYFTVGYGVSRRPAEEKTSTVGPSLFRHPRARNVATLFSPHASLTSLETWAMDLDYRHAAGFDIVRDAIDALLPGITLSHIDRDRRELVFDTPDGQIPYRLLSEGYQNVAAWTGDLLLQITEVFGDLADPFSARGLLLIDEVDLHLHPKWQRGLMQFVQTRFPNFQIVATTHSPLTVHQAGDGELFFLRRRDPSVPAELHAYEGAPRDLMLHQLLTSPLFGLTTLDSRPVEQMKNEYRALRDSETRSPEAEAELERLTDELKDLPDWSEGIEGQDELKSLLRDVRSELDGGR
ncbi:MAG TPA: AAA family ATPase [Solirubrobacteraceae bacterium]|nr:AAA family ATPase [Solirubrobacteraceae bacterium]